MTLWPECIYIYNNSIFRFSLTIFIIHCGFDYTTQIGRGMDLHRRIPGLSKSKILQISWRRCWENSNGPPIVLQTGLRGGCSQNGVEIWTRHILSIKRAVDSGGAEVRTMPGRKPYRQAPFCSSVLWGRVLEDRSTKKLMLGVLWEFERSWKAVCWTAAYRIVHDEDTKSTKKKHNKD